jgi:hypothetical protein
MYLKNITYIILTLVYLVLATKVSATIHFCGGTISSISFFEQKSEVCDCGKMSNKSCCHDFTFTCKFDNSNTNLTKILEPKFYKNFLVLSNFIIKYNPTNYCFFFNSDNFSNNKIPPLILIQLSSVLLRI